LIYDTNMVDGGRQRPKLVVVRLRFTWKGRKWGRRGLL